MFFKLNITSKIWTKESNYLFDYDSNELIKSSTSVKTNGILEKDNDKITYDTTRPENKTEETKDSNFLAKIKMNNESIKDQIIKTARIRLK